MGVRSQATYPAWGQGRQVGHEPAVLVEQFVRSVALQPLLEQGEVLRVAAEISQRHLVRPPGALGRLAVDRLRSGPTLGSAQHDHRPAWPGARAPTTCRSLDGLDLLDNGLQ